MTKTGIRSFAILIAAACGIVFSGAATAQEKLTVWWVKGQLADNIPNVIPRYVFVIVGYPSSIIQGCEYSTFTCATTYFDLNDNPQPAVVATAATPLPAALPLFATGLCVMGLLGWRRKRNNAAALAVA